KKADIVSSLKQQPWGMAEYILRDNNGHHICFSGGMDEREKNSEPLPPSIRITGRIPTIEEFQQVQVGVGWGRDPNDEKTTATLAAALHAAVAEDTTTGQVIGCALLLGDKIGFYYVKDVMVHKDWQGRNVGSALMQELTRWLEINVTHHALVGLFCRETLEPFYRRFGFVPGFGMVRYINPA
ncbi:MAG: GNAT family N-acetyltransferase, partial [Bacteroidetes bacterium]|nr:GNAT family N-acetyltransferase [Bacteroidota bacterium]